LWERIEKRLKRLGKRIPAKDQRNHGGLNQENRKTSHERNAQSSTGNEQNLAEYMLTSGLCEPPGGLRLMRKTSSL
jgi:hypothetical protein